MSLTWLLTPPVFFGLAGACLALLIVTVVLLIRRRTMHRALLKMARELAVQKTQSPPPSPEPVAPAPAPASKPRFDGMLQAEELRSRLDRHVPSREPLERYMHVRSLAEKGCEVDEIARILHISPDEVSQVLALSRIRNRSV
ncbi:MAG TPA: hypothetical protein VJ934_08000 [Desulfomicrobiaceae bacterium]|nr:hypothetical protein [Desulfomicrobiaceae bacterium]